MCDGNSFVGQGLEIFLDCDWCDGRGWMEESENPFYADEEMEAECPEREQQRVSRLTFPQWGV